MATSPRTPGNLDLERIDLSRINPNEVRRRQDRSEAGEANQTSPSSAEAGPLLPSSVVGASAATLVKMLVPVASLQSHGFVAQVMLSYRSVIEPKELLSLLIEQYQHPLSDADPRELRRLEKENLSGLERVLRHRVMHVLRHWIHIHWSDFCDDNALLGKLMDFSDGMSNESHRTELVVLIQRRCRRPGFRLHAGSPPAAVHAAIGRADSGIAWSDPPMHFRDSVPGGSQRRVECSVLRRWLRANLVGESGNLDRAASDADAVGQRLCDVGLLTLLPNVPRRPPPTSFSAAADADEAGIFSFVAISDPPPLPSLARDNLSTSGAADITSSDNKLDSYFKYPSPHPREPRPMTAALPDAVSAHPLSSAAPASGSFRGTGSTGGSERWAADDDDPSGAANDDDEDPVKGQSQTLRSSKMSSKLSNKARRLGFMGGGHDSEDAASSPGPLSAAGAPGSAGSSGHQGGEGGIVTFEPLDAARQLTLDAERHLVRIRLGELGKQAWTKKTAGERAPHVLAMIEHFNRISRWTASEIVATAGGTKAKSSDDGSARRFSTMKRLLLIADHCRRFGNYFTMYAIYCGLNMHPVTRLALTWRRVHSANKYTKLYESLEAAVNPQSNSKALRDVLSSSNPPFIPPLDLSLRDLTMLGEVPWFLENDQGEKTLINLDRLMKESKVLGALHRSRAILRLSSTDAEWLDNPKMLRYFSPLHVTGAEAARDASKSADSANQAAGGGGGSSLGSSDADAHHPFSSAAGMGPLFSEEQMTILSNLCEPSNRTLAGGLDSGLGKGAKKNGAAPHSASMNLHRPTVTKPSPSVHSNSQPELEPSSQDSPTRRPALRPLSDEVDGTPAPDRRAGSDVRSKQQAFLAAPKPRPRSASNPDLPPGDLLVSPAPASEEPTKPALPASPDKRREIVSSLALDLPPVASLSTSDRVAHAGAQTDRSHMRSPSRTDSGAARKGSEPVGGLTSGFSRTADPSSFKPPPLPRGAVAQSESRLLVRSSRSERVSTRSRRSRVRDDSGLNVDRPSNPTINKGSVGSMISNSSLKELLSPRESDHGKILRASLPGAGSPPPGKVPPPSSPGKSGALLRATSDSGSSSARRRRCERCRERQAAARVSVIAGGETQYVCANCIASLSIGRDGQTDSGGSVGREDFSSPSRMARSSSSSHSTGTGPGAAAGSSLTPRSNVASSSKGSGVQPGSGPGTEDEDPFDSLDDGSFGGMLRSPSGGDGASSAAWLARVAALEEQTAGASNAIKSAAVSSDDIVSLARRPSDEKSNGGGSHGSATSSGRSRSSTPKTARKDRSRKESRTGLSSGSSTAQPAASANPPLVSIDSSDILTLGSALAKQERLASAKVDQEPGRISGAPLKTVNSEDDEANLLAAMLSVAATTPRSSAAFTASVRETGDGHGSGSTGLGDDKNASLAAPKTRSRRNSDARQQHFEPGCGEGRPKQASRQRSRRPSDASRPQPSAAGVAAEDSIFIISPRALGEQGGPGSNAVPNLVTAPAADHGGVAGRSSAASQSSSVFVGFTPREDRSEAEEAAALAAAVEAAASQQSSEDLDAIQLGSRGSGSGSRGHRKGSRGRPLPGSSGSHIGHPSGLSSGGDGGNMLRAKSTSSMGRHKRSSRPAVDDLVAAASVVPSPPSSPASHKNRKYDHLLHGHSYDDDASGSGSAFADDQPPILVSTVSGRVVDSDGRPVIPKKPSVAPPPMPPEVKFSDDEAEPPEAPPAPPSPPL